MALAPLTDRGMVLFNSFCCDSFFNNCLLFTAGMESSWNNCIFSDFIYMGSVKAVKQVVREKWLVISFLYGWDRQILLNFRSGNRFVIVRVKTQDFIRYYVTIVLWSVMGYIRNWVLYFLYYYVTLQGKKATCQAITWFSGTILLEFQIGAWDYVITRKKQNGKQVKKISLQFLNLKRGSQPQANWEFFWQQIKLHLDSNQFFFVTQ